MSRQKGAGAGMSDYRDESCIEHMIEAAGK